MFYSNDESLVCVCVVVELRTARMYSDVSSVYGDIGGLQAHPFS